MPSITRNAPRNRRAAVDEQVLAAVERLLREGMQFTEISVARILDEVGIARSTFYVHFRDKTDLLKRLAGSLRQELVETATDLRSEGPGGGLGSLTAMFARVIAFHREHAAVMSAFVEAAAYDSDIRDFHASALESVEAIVRQGVQAQQEVGRVHANVSSEAASRIIIWGGASSIARHVQVDDGAGDREFAEEMARLWWCGVLRRGAF